MKRILPPFTTLTPERHQEVIDELGQASSPDFDYFLLVFLSCSIATFGLITNSTAVIIGAMLVAPLMSPILGLSLASVAGKQHMFRRAVVGLLEGVLLSILLAFFWGTIAQILPFDLLLEVPQEILTRTQPTPFDLGIALAGGAAAAYALAQPRLSAALPGVAIATALMPPLCTVGIGLSLGDLDIAIGASLLFLTNLTAISFAGILIFAALGFRPVRPEKTWRRIPRSLFVSAILVLLVSIPLLVLTLRIVNQAHINQAIRAAVISELAVLPNGQLVDLQIENQDSTLNLRITARSSRQPGYQEVVAIQKGIAARLQRTTAIQMIIIPTTHLDPLIPPTHTPTFTPTFTPTAGPSLTPTQTLMPTSTATSTATRTPLPTSTPTATPTPTLTSTPTPVFAHILPPAGTGTYLRDAPGGVPVTWLPEGTPVMILYNRQVFNQRQWVEVRNVLDQVGWVPLDCLVLRP